MSVYTDAMGVRVSVVVLACAVVALAVFAPATARPAAACSIVQTDLETTAAEAEIVIVGQVIAESMVDPRWPSFESTIRVAAVLRGDLELEITLSPLGFLGADCSGGPRLPVGERVLLLLSRFKGELRVYGYENGKYVLTDGEARRAFELFPPATPIPAEDALRRVAAITGATDEQLDAALAFAGVGPAPAPLPDAAPIPTDAPLPDASPPPVDVEDDGGQVALLIALASVLLALLVAALAGLGLRRRAR